MLKDILIRLTAVALSVISLAACNEAVQVGDGFGTLGVGLEWDTALQTKADADTEELGDDTQVTISICDADGNVVAGPTTYGYAALKEAVFEVPVGVYTIKASTGADQQAAWNSPFYYGESQVTVKAERDNYAEVVCRLANVKVTASFDEGFAEYCSSYGVTVDNGAGEGLTFSNEKNTLDSEGYFAVTGILNWKLVLENNDGKAYVAKGEIEGVEARQHYPLAFTLSEYVKDETGASVFRVTLDDSVTEKEFDAVLDLSENGGRYDYVTTGFDYVAGNISVPMGDENVKKITTSMTTGLKSALVRVDGKWYELVNADQTQIETLKALGIKASSVIYGAESFTVDVTDYLASIGEFGEYPITVSAYDVKGFKGETVYAFEIISNVDASAVSAVPSAYSAVLTAKWYSNDKPDGLGIEYKAVSGTEWIQVDASAITYDETQKRFSAEVTGLAAGTQYTFRPYSTNDREDIKTMEFYTDFTAPVSASPWAKFAVVTGKWLTDTKPEGLTFMYREYGTTGWIEADAQFLRLTVDEAAKTFTGDITGLEPECTYEFRAVSSIDALTNMDTKVFTTESANTIYNLNFDDWYQDGNVWYPFAKDKQHAWDTANGGTAALGSKYICTTPAEGNDAVSGKAVRMESMYVVIKFAAGNLYTGDFGSQVSMGAELDWGIPFDSKPVALRGHYKYFPSKINRGESEYQGQMDKAQIQMCLATGWTSPFHVDTNNGIFVNFNGSDIMAYGKLESDTAYSDYFKFTIPLEYRDKEAVPSYVIISACASYRGDYFTGGEGSTLYVDEFELVYDIAELTDEQAALVNYR